MTQPIRILANAVAAKIETSDRATKLIVSQALSYEVEGFEFSPLFRSKKWDGRASFFSYNKGTFPAGFVHRVYSELRSKGVEPLIVKRRPPVALGPENPIVDEFGNDNPDYDFQLEAVRRLEKHGNGIAQVATGGGKSKIAKLCIARIGRPTLFLTTRSMLMYQMKVQLEDSRFRTGILEKRIGVVGDSEWTPSAGVNVGMVQTLAARLEETSLELELERVLQAQKTAEKTALEKKEKVWKAAGYKADQLIKLKTQFVNAQHEGRMSDEEIVAKAQANVKSHNEDRQKAIDFLQTIEFVIGEEAHEASGHSYATVLKHCKRADYRLALTATPNMRPTAQDNMELEAAFGSIIIKITEKMLIDRGILARPTFKFMPTPGVANVRQSTAWSTAYKDGIVNNAGRNKLICQEALRAAMYGLPVMILVGQLAHGHNLVKMLAGTQIKVEFIRGETDNDDRQKALNRLATGKINILIGTNILDVGVDVPAVGLVILAGGGKAEIALRQRIGRGARRKKSGPNIFFVLDFIDVWNRHTSTHARERQRIIRETPGFGENILPVNDDFDYSPFIKRAA